MLYLAFIVGASLVWALPNNLPRADPPDPDFAKKVDEWASTRHPPQELADAMKNYKSFGETSETPTLEDYKQPNEFLATFMSPGDSYTAGIGSNKPEDLYKDSGKFEDKKCGRYSQAWPEQLKTLQEFRDLQGEGYIRNNFGACSGAEIQPIIDKQIKLGETKDEDQYKKIGTPQIAVLTAGGNDFRFGDVVQTCILGVWGTKNCEKTLKGIEDDLQGEKKEQAKSKYRKLLSSIIVAGRLAKGANPPESFQVYLGTYIPFFDTVDSVCDEISWNTWGSNVKLTKEFRNRLNSMVESVNRIIEEVVKEMEQWGVYLVNDYQRAFDTHRFCDAVPHFEGWDLDYDKAYHHYKNQDFGSQTWFWSWKGHWGRKLPDLGYDHPIWKKYGGPLDQKPKSIDENVNVIWEALIPDASQRTKVEKGEADPVEFSEAFKDTNSLDAAIRGIATTKEVEVEFGWITDDSWYRIFHPKGNAHTEIAKAFFQTIKRNRKWDFLSDKGQGGSPTKGPGPVAPPVPEAPPPKSKTVVIGMSSSWECNDNGARWGATLCSDYGNQWFFFETKIGEDPTDLCNDGSLGHLQWDDKRWGGQHEMNNPPWPGGTYHLWDGMVYKSDGSPEHGMGALFNANDERIGDCSGDLIKPDDPLEKFCRENSPFFKRRRVVFCDF